MWPIHKKPSRSDRTACHAPTNCSVSATAQPPSLLEYSGLIGSQLVRGSGVSVVVSDNML